MNLKLTLIRTALWAVVMGASSCALARDTFSYRGLCDASAAVALDANHFVVADDERNTLVVYRHGQADAVAALDVSAFLGTRADKESDLEGAASIGPRTYWVSSHGRNSEGKRQDRRLRFFATEVSSTAPPGPPKLTTVGKAYSGLLEDLMAAPSLAAFKLADAAAKAPEAEGGLNIEGLAATPEGHLLIGFRSPMPKQRALLVPLENPAEVIDHGARARWGQAIQLDLGGRGIRSIDRVGAAYLIVAGPRADQGSFALYRWSGDSAQGPVLVKGVDFKGLHPEALFAVPGTQGFQVLSDDGQRQHLGLACKALPRGWQGFRSWGPG
ncbi:DUF3616 domain-containing protein [Aquabacterium sp.]|uniref:DUF3616 domain-containing protein n=1 Tax=Aquabacterium sp. TaxID=1872578 RepID=UPI002489ACE9|nr:DUF3616 domain-containing protein [Aquabacterium sp.]MDI1259978.1 DUF3616 domain-containing protein [Aquabacterium sp.]